MSVWVVAGAIAGIFIVGFGVAAWIGWNAMRWRRGGSIHGPE